MENPRVESVSGLHGSNNNVIEGGRDGEAGALENEVPFQRKEFGSALGLEGLELDSAEPSRLPVFVLSGDFQSVDCIGSQLRLQEAPELLGYGCFGDV